MLNLHYFIVYTFSFHEIYYIYYYFHVHKIYFKVHIYNDKNNGDLEEIQNILEQLYLFAK